MQRTPSVIQKLLMNWEPGRRCAVRSAGSARQEEQM